MKQFYKDAVHYSFSLAHSIISDDVEPRYALARDLHKAVTLDMDFVLGQDVLHTDEEGNQEMVVYKGATPDGQWHTL